MYEDFLRAILLYLEMLNAAERKLIDMGMGSGSLPYLGKIPVELEGVIVGHLVDEIGGAWSYQPATEVADAAAH